MKRSRAVLMSAVCLIALLAMEVAAAQVPKVAGTQVVVGPARFTFLAPDLVRMEWSQQRKWLDWDTAIMQLRSPVRAMRVFAETQQSGAVRIWAAPGSLEIYYRPPAKFGPETLTVVARGVGGERVFTWKPGTADDKNLGGTRYSLDGVREGGLPPLPPGLLSRNGFFFIDDSRTPAIDPATDWLAERPDPDAQDWYFCWYGLDYRKALRLASDLMGHVYLPPRWALGSWYSRYWPYTDKEEMEIIRRFRELGIPLDILVIDVDWHLHGWESYDWNPDLFPDPEGFLRWVHAQGCKVTLNNHPGYLPAADSHFADFCRYIGVDPAGRKGIGINLADKRQCEAFFEILHKPLHEQGIDFWWIDGNAAHFPGLSSQMWTTKVYFEYTERYTGKRGLLFARYGGHGCHRYPVGFSGDTFAQWGVLKYEIGFTSRAGNVLFPWWSHDIGGFNGNVLPTELYVRWVQFGALSPVLRLHSNHGVREPWNYGKAGIECARRYFRLRYALIPYIYSCGYRTWQTGEPLCKALYMEWPGLEEAYEHDDEYLFGDALLVAPVAEPAERTRKLALNASGPVVGQADDGDQVAYRKVWLPPGQWLDWWTGQVFNGPQTLVYAAPLQRLPMFMRAGYPVVMGQVTDFVGEKPDDTLRVVFAAAEDGERSFMLFEDDGESKAYLQGGGARTLIEVKAADNGANQTVVIWPARGSFDGQIDKRRWVIEVRGITRPATVTVNGEALGPIDSKAGEGYIWKPSAGRLTLRLDERPVNEKIIVRVKTAVPVGLYRQAWRARELAGRQLVPPALAARLPRAAKMAGQLRAEAARIARALMSAGSAAEAQAAADALRRLSEQGLAELARAALEEGAGWMTPEQRLAVLTSIAGVEIVGVVEPTRDGLGAAVRVNIAQRAAGAEKLARKLVQSLKTRDGQPLAATLQHITFYRKLYPVGLVEIKVPVVGRWEKWDLAGTVTGTVDASWLQAFQLVGPFDNAERKGLDRVYPPEELAAAGKPLPYGKRWTGKDGKPVKWLKTAWRFPKTAEPVFINLEPLFKPKDWTVAYGVTYIWAPEDTDAVLLVGSDDECKVWLNGRLVHEYREPRPPAPDEDRVEIRLKRGWNMLMIKVCQEQGQWGFYLHLLGRDGKPLPGLWCSAEQPLPQPPKG